MSAPIPPSPYPCGEPIYTAAQVRAIDGAMTALRAVYDVGANRPLAPCGPTCWCHINSGNVRPLSSMRWTPETPALRFATTGIEQSEFDALREPHEVAW